VSWNAAPRAHSEFQVERPPWRRLKDGTDAPTSVFFYFFYKKKALQAFISLILGPGITIKKSIHI
jgi:hypothetical protein